MLNYFDNTWTLTELLFASLQGEPVFYVQPYHQLRHPLVFYYGHPACLYINKLRLAGLLSAPCNAHYEVLFETGVDEMSWDDLSQSHVAWPTIREVHAYRAEVYGIVRRLIETHPDLRDGAEPARPILAESPLWALAMAFEHERIHLETSAVLMRELPLPHLGRPDGWVALHPSAPATDVFEPEEGRDYPRNGMVPVEGGEVTVGKPADWPSFGWDNEYGEEERGVPPFAASRYKVSNGEMRQFVAAGGYRESRYWSDEGWKWRSFRHARWPTFWTAVGPAGLHHFRLRTLHECVPMPWAWPAEVNVHEAKAYCAWRSEEEGVPYRLTTEGEVLRVREVCGLSRPQGSDTAADPVLGPPRAGEAAINHNLAYGSPGAVDWAGAGAKGAAARPFGDPLGNVWEWCEEDFAPLRGFAVHDYYDDFSTPCFDGEHSLILGGSWLSTGDEASLWARFHFRRHFLQSAGLRLSSSLVADVPGAQDAAAAAAAKAAMEAADEAAAAASWATGLAATAAAAGAWAAAEQAAEAAAAAVAAAHKAHRVPPPWRRARS